MKNIPYEIKEKLNESKNFSLIKLDNKQLYLDVRLGAKITSCIRDAFTYFSKDINAVSFDFNNVYIVIPSDTKYVVQEYEQFYNMSLRNTNNPTQAEQDAINEKWEKERRYKHKCMMYLETVNKFVPVSNDYEKEKEESEEFRFLFDFAELVYNKTEEEEQMIYDALGGISGFQRSIIQNIIKNHFPQ